MSVRRAARPAPAAVALVYARFGVAWEEIHTDVAGRAARLTLTKNIYQYQKNSCRVGVVL